MTTIAPSIIHRLRALWLSAWPLWTLIVVAGLAFVPLLPWTGLRAVVGVPVLLLAPGSLAIGAIFSQRQRPRGEMFIFYASLVGIVCTGLASLALYVLHILITADSTYWCLLLISVVFAVTAEGRLVLGAGRGRRVAGKSAVLDADLSDTEAEDAEIWSGEGAGWYWLVALVAGVCLLIGGVFTYEKLPHSAPVGYTWLAWTGPPIKSYVAVGSRGTKLGFQINHHEPGTSAFRLSAEWLSSPSRPLATPVAVNIGPNKVYRAAILIPPLPNGCTYRIVVSLTALHQIDPHTKEPQTWSINVDVRDPRRSSKACK